MADLIIKRFCVGPMGTFGTMSVDGVTLYTVERPWLNNQPNISCIPDGLYTCKPRRFYRGGYDAIEITNVIGRTHILMHIANLPERLKGCIGINSELGCLYGQWAGRGSRDAFNYLMQKFGGREFTLSIVTEVEAAIST